MAFAQGSSSRLAYVPEVTAGVTPTSPSMVAIPFTSHSLDLTRQTLQSNDIRGDRQTAFLRTGNDQVGGNLAVDFRPEDYDPFLESLLQSAFATNVLKVGSTRKSFTFEDGALDIGKYRVSRGCEIGSARFSFKPNQMVTCEFGVVGRGQTSASSPLDAGVTPASTNQPLDGFTGTFKEGGGTVGFVTGVDFEIQNSLSPEFVLGSRSAAFVGSGRCQITGTLTAYFQDLVQLNKFLNETESSLEIDCPDIEGVTGNSYKFEFPRIKYSGGSAPVQNEGSRTISMPFQALLDPSSGSEIKITKY